MVEERPVRTRGRRAQPRGVGAGWERGHSGATCTAHRPWLAKQGCLPAPTAPESDARLVTRGMVRTPARPAAACPTFRRTRRINLWMWSTRRKR